MYPGRGKKMDVREDDDDDDDDGRLFLEESKDTGKQNAVGGISPPSTTDSWQRRTRRKPLR
jgi:hypothetical protein